MQIKYTVSPDDFVAFNMSYMYNSPIMRANIRNTRIISALIVLIGGTVLMQVLGKLNIISVLIYVAFAALVFFALPYTIKKKVRKGIMRMLMQPQNSHVCTEKALTLDEKELSLVGGGEDSHYTYDTIERVTEDAEHYFIYVGAMAALIVPYRAFATGEEKAAFYNMLCQRVQQNGGKIKA